MGITLNLVNYVGKLKEFALTFFYFSSESLMKKEGITQNNDKSLSSIRSISDGAKNTLKCSLLQPT